MTIYQNILTHRDSPESKTMTLILEKNKHYYRLCQSPDLCLGWSGKQMDFGLYLEG